MMDGRHAEFTELAQLVIDIAREIQLRAARTTPVVPLTQTQGQVMRYVHLHPACTPSEIADGSGLQRANVSAALRELRARDYLTTERDELDGRAQRITATPLADANIAKLRSSWAGLLEDAWRTETDQMEPDAAIAALSRIRAGLGARRAAAHGAGGATKGFSIATPAPAGDGEDSNHPTDLKG